MAILEQTVGGNEAAAQTQPDPIRFCRDDLNSVAPQRNAHRRLNQRYKIAVIKWDSEKTEGMSTQSCDDLFRRGGRSHNDDLDSSSLLLLQTLEQRNVGNRRRARAGDNQIKVIIECSGEQLFDVDPHQFKFGG